MNRQIRVGVREYWSWTLGKGLESARVEEGVGHAGLQMVKVGKADDKLGRQHVVVEHSCSEVTDHSAEYHLRL